MYRCSCHVVFWPTPWNKVTLCKTTWGKPSRKLSGEIQHGEEGYRSLVWRVTYVRMLSRPLSGMAWLCKGTGVRARVVTLTLTLGTCDPLIPRFIWIQLHLIHPSVSGSHNISIQNERRSKYLEIKWPWGQKIRRSTYFLTPAPLEQCCRGPKPARSAALADEAIMKLLRRLRCYNWISGNVVMQS